MHFIFSLNLFPRISFVNSAYPFLRSVKPLGFSLVALLQQRIDIYVEEIFHIFIFSLGKEQSDVIKETRQAFRSFSEEKGWFGGLVSKIKNNLTGDFFVQQIFSKICINMVIKNTHKIPLKSTETLIGVITERSLYTM